jgi:hypothetical protein
VIIWLAILQLNAILEELRFTSYSSGTIANALSALRKQLQALSAREVTADDHETRFPGLPLRRLAGPSATTLAFAAPTSVEAVGSFVLHTISKVQLQCTAA